MLIEKKALVATLCQKYKAEFQLKIAENDQACKYGNKH